MKYDTKDTLLARGIIGDNLDIKLNEIIRRLEMFHERYGCHPKQILISLELFEEIQEKKSELLKEFDEQYFLLCMKIVF